jgi:hypothetical protein
VGKALLVERTTATWSLTCWSPRETATWVGSFHTRLLVLREDPTLLAVHPAGRAMGFHEADLTWIGCS